MKQMIAKLKDIDEQWKILGSAIIIVMLFGVLPSCCTSDWEWFSRSGALLVVYGIYIVWRDIKGDIRSTMDQLDNAVSEKYGEKSEEFSVLVKTLQKKNKRLYETIEFLILAAGTVIWAYGDLINKLHS